MKKPNRLSRLLSVENNPEIPFFLFLTLVLVGIYIWSLIDSPALDSSWKIGLFTVTMTFHITLYWISPKFFTRPRWLISILVVQGLLALSMGFLTRVVGITIGLYTGLIGLVIGLPIKRKWRILWVGFFLTLSLVNYLSLTGLSAAHWWILTTVPIVLFVTLYVTMYTAQAEARERSQSLLKDLETANRQLSEYAAQLEDLTLTNERQRVARELHDTLSQGLAGLILQLEAADAHLGGNHRERARSILQNSMEQARRILASARQVIDDLRQPAGHDLVKAVEQEAGRFCSTTGIDCKPQIEIGTFIPEMVSEAALRVISEALTNIANHAQAKNAWLRIVELHSPETLSIEIQDDGMGFDPEVVQAGHYGLLGMRERVQLAGGSMDVISEKGKGTRIVARIPLEEHVEE